MLSCAVGGAVVASYIVRSSVCWLVCQALEKWKVMVKCKGIAAVVMELWNLSSALGKRRKAAMSRSV